MRKPITAWLRLLPAVLLIAGCNGNPLAVEMTWPDWWPFREERQHTPGAPASAVAPLIMLIQPVAEPEEAFLRERLAAFAKSNPGPPVELVIAADYDRRLREPDETEQPADLFLATGFALPTLIAANLLAPVPAEYDRLAEVAPSLRPGFGVGDRPFCLPRDAHTLALAYNPALFDRADVPYPNDSWQWNDLALAADAVNDEDFFLFALTLNPDLSRIAPFMLQAGGDWIDAATGLPTFDTPQAQAGISFFVDLFRSGNAVYDTTLDSVWAGEAFGRGSAGMTVEGSWLLPFLAQDFPRFEFGTAELPAGAAGRATLAFTTCVAVNPNSPQRNRAYVLADYLTGPDVAADWRSFHGGMPVNPDELAAWQAADPLRRPFAAGVAYARVWQFPINQSRIPELATPIIRSVIAGEQSVETLAQRLQSAALGSN